MAFKDLRFSKNQLDSAGTFYELMLLILKNKGMTDSNKDTTIESECKTELLSKLDLEVLKEIREDIQKSLEDSTTKEIMTSFKKLYMREDPDALRIINLFKNLNEKTSDLEFLKRETKMLEGLLSNLNGKQVAGLYALLKWDAPCGAEAAILSRIVSSEKVNTGDEMIHMIQSITAMTVTANITKTTTVGKVYNNVATKKSFRKKNDIRCFLCGKMGHIKSHCPEYTIQRKVKLIAEREVMDREESDDDLSSIGMIDQVGKVSNGKRRLLIDIEIDGRKMKAEADTGSPVSFVSKANFDNNCIQPTKRRFCGLEENEIKIYVYVADIDHGIIGLEELKSVGLINSLLQLVSIINEPGKDEKATNKFVERFPKLFSLGLGCYTGQLFRLKWKRESELLDKIKQCESEGLWCEEKYPISASSVICIIKKLESGVSTENIRFVSDFKCLNKNLKKNCFPLESVDVTLMKGISSKEVKSELLKYMPYVRIPTYFFSDQGRQFITEDVQQLVKRSEHQSSNGQAERFVGTIKNALKKMGPNKGTVEESLARVIISINNVECGIRKETPLNMIKKRMVHPLIKKDERTNNSKFKKGELVMFKKRKEDEWKSGVVDESVEKMVKIRRGLVQYLFHIDNVRKCNVNMNGLSLDSVMTKEKPISVSKCKNKRKIVDDHEKAPIRKFRVTKQRTDAFKYSK
uniref:CCHC-type domain-containing protein n=1 Tax=Strongyloides papillosus TaxID=174720 RepID=A0A0N5BP41_STREA